MRATTVIKVWRDGIKVSVGGQDRRANNGRAEFPDTEKGTTYSVYVDGRKRDTVRGGQSITITQD